MRMRALADHRYWLDGSELRLSPSSDVPTGVKAWDYSKVTVSATSFASFLSDARRAGLPDETVKGIQKELGL